MPHRTRTVTDVGGHNWEVSVILTVFDEDGFSHPASDLRDALPGPVLERLRDQLRDDVEVMV